MDVNNLYGWKISQKHPVNSIYWIEKKIKIQWRKWYFLEVDVQYTKKFLELHKDLPFLSDRAKIEKIEKLVANLHR